ncbi:MAG: hypothetical protein EB830_00785 [Nitrosopumilus sp. H13]|nr:MAG: hypothetical protein EB830_00785 [Nitrosopumilus sp. H13]
MLDKNPDLSLDCDLASIQDELKGHAPSIVLCREPFHKAEFLDRMIGSAGCPVVFVDMDLLYTGYLRSAMIQGRDDVTVVCPDKKDWRKRLADIIVRASEERILIVIDTFNGAYNIFDDLESVRLVNSCIMLLSCMGRQTGSSVIVAAMARRREDGRWVLSPGGRQVMSSERTGIFFLRKAADGLTVSRLGTGPRPVF